jgi:transmembrane sensor
MDLAATRAALARDLPAAEREQLWARIDAHIPLQRPSRSALLSRLRWEAPWPRWVWALGSAVVVLNLWFAYENFWRDRGALTLEGGQALGTVSAEHSVRHLRFSDQSTIALNSHSQLTALAMTDDQVLLRLERGSAQFHVKKGGRRRWRIESGLLAVEVIGTRFSVQRSATQVEVTVSEGRVLVRSAALTDGVVRLDAGQEVTVQAPSVAERQNEAIARSGLADPSDLTTLPQPPPAQIPPARQSASLAGKQPSLSWLLAHADEARAAGESKRAASLLLRIVQLYPHDPQAALSSFALGRIQQREGQWAAADTAYSWALHHGASGSLREDCYLRRIEVQLHLAKKLAQRTAHEYLSLYPQGRHGAAIEHMLQSDAASPAR